MPSRSRLFHLSPLTTEQVRDLLLRALHDTERGYGDRPISISDDALSHLADMAGGDARTALNALELAVESTAPDSNSLIHIDDTVAEESIQRRVVRYDKVSPVRIRREPSARRKPHWTWANGRKGNEHPRLSETSEPTS